MQCPFCSHTLEEKVSFRTICPSCDKDLHCCMGCTYYDENKPYQCTRSDIEPVREKEKANFCEYFSLSLKPLPKKKTTKAANLFHSLFKESSS